MGEQIVWAEMTPEQRNALVAEKVMGIRVVGYSWGVYVTTDEDDNITGNPKPYTTDMNAAWEVVEHITEPPTKPLGLQSPNILFTQWWQQSAIWACPRQEAAENICIAALQACGVDLQR